MAEPIFTIGHSTRPIEEFVAMLTAQGVTLLADVRTVPRSRHNPQFGSDALAESLQLAGIGYLHLPELGGLRKPRPDSRNMGWRNASFRGYADYMDTAQFEAGLQRLLEEARGRRAAAMCAEAMPWRCHRSLLADALTARGHEVLEISGVNKTKPHSLTAFAQVRGDRVSYPSPEPQLELFSG